MTVRPGGGVMRVGYAPQTTANRRRTLMAANRRVSFVRMDARRHFLLFVAFVLFCGTSFVAGVLVGQRNPRPIAEHFDAEYEAHPQAEATLSSPDPQRVYTFEDRLTAAETRLDREAVVEPDAPAHSQRPLGETVAAADTDSEPRALDREPIEAVAAPTPAPEQEPIGEDAVAEPAAQAEDVVAAAPRALTRETDPAQPQAAPAAAAPRALERTADEPQPFELTVASADTWDDAAQTRQALRDVGLRATIVTAEEGGERRFDVVLRGDAPGAEVSRQQQLAERVLAARN